MSHGITSQLWVIGTSKSDQSGVVDLIIESLKGPKASKGISALFKPGHKVADQLLLEKLTLPKRSLVKSQANLV